ncbi:toll/interleukin-1 receptor domain-containing protein [Thermodesulfobacteriota bacterium]
MGYFTKAMLEEDTSAIRTFDAIIAEKTVTDADSFNIFLSHSYKDKRYIHKLKEHIENIYRITCYVDWINEPRALDRNNIDHNTAELLRKRMSQSQSLIFCTSDNSSDSKWMPWELGYFDALKGRVAILPIVDEGKTFIGQEYLGLYPYIDMSGRKICVNSNRVRGKYVNLSEWLMGENL